MSIQITTAFVQQYRDNVIHLSQQKGSRLRNAVRIEDGVVGENFYFERVGETAAVRRTTRHGDTPLLNTPHTRRRVSLIDYDWGDLVDNADKLRLLIDPQSQYVKSGAWALGRAMDDEIIEAFDGLAFTGRDGSVTSGLPSTQQVLAAGVGLNIPKLLSTREILEESDVDPDEARFIVVAPDNITDLLNTTEVTSADFNTVRALSMGQIDTYMGFKFIISNRLPSDGLGGATVNFAWAMNAIGLAIGQDIITRISERPDKNYSVQVYLSEALGATRVEDEKIIQIDNA